MTLPIRRRVGTSIAALALVVGLASGCTAGDWRYESPPAAGVQTDAGPVKVRNLMVLANSEGEGLLLGSLFTTETVKLTSVGLAAEQEDGSFSAPVPVEISGEVPVKGGLTLGGADARIEGADLREGMLAKVLMQFSDGTSATVDAPVLSAEHSDYSAEWEKAGMDKAGA